MRFAPFIALVALAACTRTEPTAGPAGSSSTTGAAADKTSIAIKGSDTMVILGQRWAETYMKANAGITITVTGGGSGTGIAALINGTTDICESSRPMKDKEKEDVKAKRNAPAVETKVALDALAVYVNEKSDLTEISVAQLAKVYKGEAKTWKDIGGKSTKPIVVYGRENNSGTYGFFKEHVLENKDFAAGVQTLAGTSAVVAAVKGDENGMGYGGIAYSEGVHVLKLKKDDSSPAILGTLETAQNGTYPLSRFLYFYTAGDATGSMKKFIDWVQAPDGQKVIEEVGYYPLPKK
jgi:phosphate transport system substrate-binding protein